MNFIIFSLINKKFEEKIKMEKKDKKVNTKIMNHERGII
jgi:hypothetical protein